MTISVSRRRRVDVKEHSAIELTDLTSTKFNWPGTTTLQDPWDACPPTLRNLHTDHYRDSEPHLAQRLESCHQQVCLCFYTIYLTDLVSKLTKFSVNLPMTMAQSSSCDVALCSICTSGFVDDVVFFYNGPYGGCMDTAAAMIK